MAKNYKAPKSQRLGLNVRRTVVYLVFAFFCVLALFPFFVLIINMTRAHTDIVKGFSLIPGDFFKQNLTKAIEKYPVFTGLWNSFFVSTCCAVLSTYFSALTAYAIHAYNFKFKKFAFAFILLIMMIPTQISVLGFWNMMDHWGLLNNFIPLIVPSIASPIVFFFMKQYMESVLPLEIVEASRIDGSGEFRTFNRVVLPILKPAIAVQAIFSFVSAWNNFFVPQLIIDKDNMKTLPLLIYQARNEVLTDIDLGKIYMLIGFSIVPVMIVYFILSKQIIRGVTLGGVKG